MSILGILENAIANLVAIALIAITTYSIIYIKMSGLTKIFWRFLHPEKRVFALQPLTISKIERLKESKFLSPVSKHEQEILVRFYTLSNNVRLFNGISVRLDDLHFLDKQKKEAVAKVSKVGFFDFISTNLTVYPANEPVYSLRKQFTSILRSIHSFSIIQQVGSEVHKNGRPRNVLDVLQNRHLANIVAVSVLIIDSQGKAGIVQRTKKVAISSGNFGSTCAGTVSETDFLEDNPFTACVVREVKEELNLSIQEMQFDGIVVPKQKMQPIFLYHVHIDQTWEELFPTIQQARDISFETLAFYAVPIEQLIPFAAHCQMTDAAAYQVWQFAKQNGYQRSWYASILRPIRINRFRLPWQGCCHHSQKITVKAKPTLRQSQSKYQSK